jgi:hypothetical protein
MAAQARMRPLTLLAPSGASNVTGSFCERALYLLLRRLMVSG